MSTTTVSPQPDRLFALLPSLYRIADMAENDELRALLELITSEADALRGNVEELWNDFFIETCSHWVIPYIGDLVGNVPLHDLDTAAAAETAEQLFTDLLGPDLRPPGTIPTRADVAETIYYRRRKGTPAMLEQLAAAVTGWGAHVVEFFQLLDWNQNLEHLRPDCEGCPDIRSVDVCDRIGGAWDTTMHTVDVRPIESATGWYGMPKVGLFLWRLAAYPLERSLARAIGGSSWRYTVSPLGQNVPLFSRGQTDDTASGLVDELHVSLPIRAAAFFEDIDAFYGDPSVAAIQVFHNGTAFANVRCADLERWNAMAQPTDDILAIDPTRGRLAVPDAFDGEEITVSWFYGFSAPLGGGRYARRNWLAAPRPHEGPTWHVPADGDLDNRIANRGASSVIEITDDNTYRLSSTITVGAGESLVIQAADGCRPTIRVQNRTLTVLAAGEKAHLTLDGLVVEGGLEIDGDLELVRLLHTTMVPGRTVEEEGPADGRPSLVVTETGTDGHGNPILFNMRLEVQLAFAVTGTLQVPAHAAKLTILDSIVAGDVSNAAGDDGPPARIERTTVFGSTWLHSLELGSESIFAGALTVDERQTGCVRFSWLPDGSRTPQRYRCQPGLEISRRRDAAKAEAIRTGTPLPAGWDTAIANDVLAWLVPSFVSVDYGHPAFAQLRLASPIQIRTGAEDGSEMGAFSVLKQPQREANLRLRLQEYLPVGLEAGLIFVT